MLLTAPLLSALKRWQADAEIVVLVKQGTEAMLAEHPAVDRVLCFPVRHEDESGFGFLKRNFGFLLGLRKYHFDLVINTTEGDRGILAAWFTRAKQRVGVALPGERRAIHGLLTDVHVPRTGRIHTVLRNLEIFPITEAESGKGPSVVMGLAKLDVSSLNLVLDGLLSAEQQDLPWIHIHPTSRWLFKCWHNQGMADVIDVLQDKGFTVMLTASADARELQRIDDICRLCRTDPVNLGGKLSLGQLAALSTRCELFFGVDSAPMHMAAALDIPVVALFGPSGTFDWGPWPNGWQGEGWQGGDTPYPAVSGVQRAGRHRVIQDGRACVPCGKAGCDDSKRSACLDELSSVVVLQQIEEHLDALKLNR